MKDRRKNPENADDCIDCKPPTHKRSDHVEGSLRCTLLDCPCAAYRRAPEKPKRKSRKPSTLRKKQEIFKVRLTRESFVIWSGGQTGVDRAALDSAITLEIPHGGWCPHGRLCENGWIPSKYQLKETANLGYTTRTVKNVQDSDATLVLFWREPTGGTHRTIQTAQRLGKPLASFDLANPDSYIDSSAVRWMLTLAAQFFAEGKTQVILNVAGPRSSMHPMIAGQARRYMDRFLEGLGFYPLVNK